MGSFPPRNGIIGMMQTKDQIWSGQQNALTYDFKVFGIRFGDTIPFFTFVAMDQVAPSVSPFKSSYFGFFSPGTLLGKALFWLFPPLKILDKAVRKYVNQTRPNPDYRFSWISPYVYFAPRANNRPGIGPFGALGNFAQPDVVAGLAYEGRDYNAEAGARYFGRRFSWNGRGAGRGAVDFSYTNQDWPQIPGMPRNLQVLHKGLNALSAAQAYYHRPGEWKEQPNFFNPLWGARLIPLRESNAAAKLGFTSVPLISNFLLH
jgi:hypothetical protein